MYNAFGWFVFDANESVHIYSNRIGLQAAPQPVFQEINIGKAPPSLKLTSNVRIKVNDESKLKQH